MTASDLLHNLRQRGVTVQLNAGQISLIAEPGVLDDADVASVRQYKPALIQILTLPRHGSINRPMIVHGSKLKACPWDGCGGRVAARENLYLCLKCEWLFRLIPMEGEHEL